MSQPKFDIEVQLSGHDGNAYNIMGRVANALKAEGATKEEVAQYHAESTSGDYNHLLQTAGRWVHVS